MPEHTLYHGSQVARKIALFESSPESMESIFGHHQCRLKRKHAIRRKKFIRERPSSIAVAPMTSRLSEDQLDKLLDAMTDLSQNFSISLLDMVNLACGETKKESLYSVTKPPELFLRSVSMQNLFSSEK